MNISQYIADRLIAHMRLHGLNKSQVANILRCQPSTVTRYLSGKHNFTVETLQYIQNQLHINFFHYAEQQTPCFPCDQPMIKK